MRKTIRSLLSATIMICILSFTACSSSPDSGKDTESTKAVRVQTAAGIVPKPLPTTPSTKVSKKATGKASDPSTKAAEKTYKPSSQEDDEEYTYVLNKNTKKFHYPDCGSVKLIKSSNKKVMTASRDEIIDMGYVACKICEP